MCSLVQRYRDGHVQGPQLRYGPNNGRMGVTDFCVVRHGYAHNRTITTNPEMIAIHEMTLIAISRPCNAPSPAFASQLLICPLSMVHAPVCIMVSSHNARDGAHAQGNATEGNL